jgi:signal transduction histidine kinase
MMVSTNQHDAFSNLGIRWQTLAWQGFLGFLLGCLVLHPVSMVIFQWFDPRMTAATPDKAMSHRTTDGVFTPIGLSFTPAHLPMALAFGMIAGLIATGYAYHRLTVSLQRDRLAKQAGQLRERNLQLAKMELANRRATQFMAHDFKTALSCIGGFSQELLDKPALRGDPEVSSTLACIRRQAHQMMGSVLDLLQLARMRERGDPPKEAVSVKKLLGDAASDFSLPAQAQQVTLGEQHRHCPDVLANHQLLHRVLCNLISNAVRHNRSGTCVWLDAQLHPSGREIVFSCRDDGAGVPADVLPSLFREFVEVRDASKGSTGLGLAFCKAAVESHGGRIWCENLVQGAQFCFTIPLYKEHSND